MGTQETTVGHLLETYYRESNDYGDRGDRLERLMRSQLTTEPAWAFQLSEVWLLAMAGLPRPRHSQRYQRRFGREGQVHR
jgi:hypothetical protein